MPRLQRPFFGTYLLFFALSAPAFASSFGDLNCDDDVNVTDVQLSIIVALGMPISDVLDADQDGTPDACPGSVSCGTGTVLEDGACVVDQTVLDEAYAQGLAANAITLENAILSGANLKNTVLSGANMQNVDLSSGNLQYATVTGVDLSGATLWGLFSAPIVGCPGAMPEDWHCVALTDTYRVLVGPGANLAGANLAGADLSGINLSNAFLGNANLTGANLTGALLTDANLKGANLTDALVTDADFTGANLTNAVLTGANMDDAILCTVDAECDDGNVCTSNTCFEGSCVTVENDSCCLSDDECDDGLTCTLTACVAFSCQTTPISNGCCAAGECTAVFEPPGSTFTLPTPTSTFHYYADIQAAFPQVDWSTLDRLYIPAGQYTAIHLGNLPDRSPDHPLIITNKGGQVLVDADTATVLFYLGGGSNWILTGRWDPVGKTGHPDFTGHDGNTYAHTTGTYGFFIDDNVAAQATNGIGIAGGATEFEVEFVEITRVGFAGMSMKTDTPTGGVNTVEFAENNVMENVKIHDLYIHDTGSEGVYFGSTQAQPQHKIMGLKFYNNRILRTGTEMVQIGQVGGGSEIHNNVFLMGALDWKDAFQLWQDKASQLAPRDGGVTVHHNVFIGAGEDMISLLPVEWAGDIHEPGELVHYHNNYFSHCRNATGMYLSPYSSGNTTYRIEDNVFRGMEFSYDETYPNAVPPTIFLRVSGQQTDTVEVFNNVWDGPATTIVTPNPSVVESGNTHAPSAPIAFVDSGFPADFDYSLVELWAQWSGLNSGIEIVYNPGDYVMHEGLLYKCVGSEPHTNKNPHEHPDVWELQPMPADDVRLAPGSPYEGIGLVDTVL